VAKVSRPDLELRAAGPHSGSDYATSSAGPTLNGAAPTSRFPGSATTVCPHKSSPMTNDGLLRRCLHDETTELRVRAAGALVLRYGQTTTRIVELTRAIT
jgi:hypothetical protein